MKQKNKKRKGGVLKMKLKERLKICRSNMKLSQQQVADKLGISKSKYCRMENGEAIPNMEELELLLKIFNINYYEFINTKFPTTRTMCYSKELLEKLSDAIKQNSSVADTWSENRERLNNLKEALEPVLQERKRELSFPEFDLSEIPDGTTIKTIKIDCWGESLIDRCLDVQNKLLRALYG